MKYAIIAIITALVSAIIGLLIYSNSLSNKLENIEKEKITLQNELSSCQSALSLQNTITTAKNNELSTYSETIKSIQEKYNKQSSDLDEALADVKTCEQGMNYLKAMLKKLKEM